MSVQAEEKEAALQKSRGRVDRHGGGGGKDKKGGKGREKNQGKQQQEANGKGNIQNAAKWSKELDTGQIQPYVKKRKVIIN